MFSRIGRSVYRSSRTTLHKQSAFLGSHGLRSTKVSSDSAFTSFENGRLGLLRSYLTSIGAGKQFLKSNVLKEFNPNFWNHSLRRLFCSQAPKKKKDSGAGGQWNIPEMSEELQDVLVSFLLLTFVLSWMVSIQRKQISFKEFKNKLLEPGLVDHIVVSNKSVAKVYVRSSPANDGQTKVDTVQGSVGDTNDKRNLSQHKFYFNIRSVESFKEELEEAQEALGFDPHNYIPVTYEYVMSWVDNAMWFPTMLFVMGTLLFIGRKNGLGIGGPGGKGGQGIFGFGKVPIKKMDKNSKNKVFFKDVAGCDEAKQEIMEFVHFLQNPKKYEELGAKIPKGALLVGPPGTGKTLLAKATAGESGVPFLSISPLNKRGMC